MAEISFLVRGFIPVIPFTFHGDLMDYISCREHLLIVWKCVADQVSPLVLALYPWEWTLFWSSGRTLWTNSISQVLSNRCTFSSRDPSGHSCRSVNHVSKSRKMIIFVDGRTLLWQYSAEIEPIQGVRSNCSSWTRKGRIHS
jgi:hypothetical protein